jgi:hypothetical protein
VVDVSRKFPRFLSRARGKTETRGSGWALVPIRQSTGYRRRTAENIGLVRKWDSSVVSSSPFSSDFPPFLCAPDPFPDWAEHFTEARKEDDEDEEETGMR